LEIGNPGNDKLFGASDKSIKPGTKSLSDDCELISIFVRDNLPANTFTKPGFGFLG